MTTDLFYLTLSAILAALLWMPYIVSTIALKGLLSPADYKAPLAREHPAWWTRLKRCHENMLESFAPFAALVLVAHLTETANQTTAVAAMVYFWGRVAHFILYALGVPFGRTAAFAVSWAATIVIAVQILV
ncbi:MAG: MAPEG family protein [Maricaulaceae bacterium]|jgi:uncharacterized MAPEG superfamily protein